MCGGGGGGGVGGGGGGGGGRELGGCGGCVWGYFRGGLAGVLAVCVLVRGWGVLLGKVGLEQDLGGLHGVIDAPADGEDAVGGAGAGDVFGGGGFAQDAACALERLARAVFDASQEEVLVVLVEFFLKFVEGFKGGAVEVVAGF